MHEQREALPRFEWIHQTKKERKHSRRSSRTSLSGAELVWLLDLGSPLGYKTSPICITNSKPVADQSFALAEWPASYEFCKQPPWCEHLYLVCLFAVSHIHTAAINAAQRDKMREYKGMHNQNIWFSMHSTPHKLPSPVLFFAQLFKDHSCQTHSTGPQCPAGFPAPNFQIGNSSFKFLLNLLFQTGL